MLLASYFPGSSFLHRASAGAKLIGLAFLAVILIAVPGPYLAPVSALALATCAVAVRVPWRYIAVPVTIALITASALAIFHYVFTNTAAAVRVSTSLVALVLAASIVTTTTSVDAMLDVLQALAAPVSRLPGVRRTGFTPERFALAVSVMLRAIPTIIILAQQTRHAAIARGLGRSPRALIVPVVLRTVHHAQRTSEALAARGLEQ